MTEAVQKLRQELERVRKVSDMLCTAHAGLRDRYARRALCLDLTILALSTWLVALVFVEPQINISLTPAGLDSRIWIGSIGVVTFFLTILQLRTDWKGRADAHKRSFSMYAEVKRECGYLLAFGHDITRQECQRLLARYDMASDVGIHISEPEFLKQKRRHKTKIALSQYLDSHPSASIVLTKVKFLVRDNFSKGDKSDDRKSSSGSGAI